MVRTIVSTKLKEDFPKAGLNGLADDAADVLTTSERDCNRVVGWNFRVMAQH
jgi:hypothetical protein